MFLQPAFFSHRDITAQLDATINEATAFYGAVAFWTIGPGVILTKQLVSLLQQPGSFCVVDLHLPTNPDKIQEFYDNGVRSFYIQAQELKAKDGSLFLHRNLLHTKMLLFDLPGGQASLWVGSHNFTKQALTGLNREASVVIPCEQHDPVYKQARGYLEAIRTDKHCEVFKPSRLADYKKLQGQPEDEMEGGCYVLPLAWNSDRMDDLAGDTIALVGYNEAEAIQLATNNGLRIPLAVRAYDVVTGTVTHYKASVQNQGLIDPLQSSSYDVAFGSRHLATRAPNTMPYVTPRPETLNKSHLIKFGFWASILIEEQLPEPLKWEPIQPESDAKWETQSSNKQPSFGLFSELPRTASSIADRLESESSTDSNFSSVSLNSADARRFRRTVPDWLIWATNRKRSRSASNPDATPETRAAVFSDERLDTKRQDRTKPTALLKLDEFFRPKQRLLLRDNFEQLARDTYTAEATSGPANPRETPVLPKLPKLPKLLLRYRLIKTTKS